MGAGLLPNDICVAQLPIDREQIQPHRQLLCSIEKDPQATRNTLIEDLAQRSRLVAVYLSHILGFWWKAHGTAG